MKYIINNKAIVLFINNKPVKVEKTDPRFSKIVQAFDLPTNDQEKEILSVLSNEVQTDNTVDDFQFKGDEVFLYDEKLPNVLAKKVISLYKSDLPISMFKNFWKNLRDNPSSSAVSELYEFLEYKELPITEDGCFLAYKGLDINFWSVSGNKDTKVLKGDVDSFGKIFNGVGQTIEVLRRDVDDDRRNHCSHGLHVGSHDYARSFSTGKMVVVKVNPKDVVSVPDDCSCQKCRVASYTVVSEYTEEISATAVKEDNTPMKSVSVEKRDEFLNRINSYLTRQSEKGVEVVSVRKIQNSFSPEYPSRERVLDALDSLGYNWNEDDAGYSVYLSD